MSGAPSETLAMSGAPSETLVRPITNFAKASQRSFGSSNSRTSSFISPRLLGSIFSEGSRGRRGRVQRLPSSQASVASRGSNSALDLTLSATDLEHVSHDLQEQADGDPLEAERPLSGINEACDSDVSGIINLPFIEDDQFLVDTGFFSRCSFVLLGFLCFSIASICILVVGRSDSSDPVVRLALFACGLLLLLLSLALLLRFHAPKSMHILRVEGAWCVSLQRRGASPKIRPLEDLEAFVESFGYLSRCRLCERGAGFTTCSAGTVHLFFGESSAGPHFSMAASLHNPLAFFTKLRDVLIVTSHPLAVIAEEYVADWVSDDGATQADAAEEEANA